MYVVSAYSVVAYCCVMTMASGGLRSCRWAGCLDGPYEYKTYFCPSYNRPKNVIWLNFWPGRPEGPNSSSLWFGPPTESRPESSSSLRWLMFPSPVLYRERGATNPRSTQPRPCSPARRSPRRPTPAPAHRPLGRLTRHLRDESFRCGHGRNVPSICGDQDGGDCRPPPTVASSSSIVWSPCPPTV
jgi:hypothetical protein